ncbi:MAG TPA: hypothetical protein DEB17_11130 [Chlorobaculum sp.]|uniref:Uncharacterized protein n=1 Tax=Chlorobaculum tepidum (strain ATCC 49652 / DSM 12025 / NBRC 103806 / TLS) TaxID=194439 RepID=Q8KCM2_CHLTE|nr:hypothetical protein CT1392 [Chlorobaculum tepidum TLS]HBU24521.1 hypothetical protein [Chlorobaculum sp.]
MKAGVVSRSSRVNSAIERMFPDPIYVRLSNKRFREHITKPYASVAVNASGF